MSHRLIVSCLTLLSPLGVAAALAEPPPSGPTPAPKNAATPDAKAKPESHPFEEQILKAAADYKAYQRVSDRANWAPAMCMLPPPTGAQLSTSASEQTHGRKLYFLYAKDAGAYDAMSQHGTLGYPGTKDTDAAQNPWSNPIGQVVVKESFKPVEVADKDKPALEKDTFGSTHLPREYVELNGKLHRTGDASGLFIMLKLDPKTEGTDEGWVYAVTSPDSKSVIESGRIASCMNCHEQTTRDRLYGHQWSWPRGKDGKVNPPLKPEPAKPAKPDDMPVK